MVGYNNQKELIEKKVAFKVNSMWPAIYRDEGEELVQLVKDYYEFLETEYNQSHYNARRMYEYRDISTTLSSMIIHFQKAFLADLPALDDQTIRIVIKNIMDLYRRKGTRGGIIVFFRLFYQEDASVVYPSKYMLKPSDSAWKTGTYLQMFPNDNIFISNNGLSYTYEDLLGKNIKGSVSGAKAVVDKINFIIKNKTILPIIYLNNVKGIFQKYDDILARLAGEDVSFGKIGGSLNEVAPIDEAYGGTTGNEIGDVYNVRSKYGAGGKVLVTEVSNQKTGIITYNLTDGGFGYTIAGTRLEVSNQVIVFNNEDFIFDPLLRVEQPATSAAGTVIGQNSVVAGVKLDSGSPEFDETGHINTAASTDPLKSVKLIPEGETGLYNGTYTLIEAMQRAADGQEPELTNFTPIVGTRQLGDLNNDTFVNQMDVDNLTQYYAGTLTDEATINWIEQDFKIRLTQNPLYRAYPAYKAYFNAVSIKNETSPGPLYPDTLNTDHVKVESLSYIQNISLITDLISDFLNVTLNSTNYNTVPPALQAMSGTADPVTLATPLNQAFDLTPFDIGVIDAFENINPGADYVNDVFALVRDETMIPFARYEQIIILENITAAFSVGDIIQQQNSLVYGKITEVNSGEKFIKVTPYAYYGFNSTDDILFRGNNYSILAAERDYTSKVIGANAEMIAKTIFESGRITGVRVINSGFAYPDGETVFIVDDDNNIQARGTSVSVTQGITEGFWGELTSHINGYTSTLAENGTDVYYEGQMRIQDSDFYQEYSYDVKSAVSQERYTNSLHKNVHLAGTKQFGSFLYQKKQNSGISQSFYHNVKNDYTIGDTDIVGPGQDVGQQGTITMDTTGYTADTTVLTADVVN